MNQLVIGAALPYLITLVVYLARKGRATVGLLTAGPLFMMLGSLWAVFPDLPRVLGYRDLYNRLAGDPRTNIFFWHYTIDKVETNSSIWFVLFVLMTGSLLAAAWRELRIREQRGGSR